MANKQTKIPAKANTDLTQYLNRIATGDGKIPEKPDTDVEEYLDYIIKEGVGEAEPITALPSTGREGKIYILVDDLDNPTKASGIYTYIDGKFILASQPASQTVKLVDQLPTTGEDGVLYYVPKAGADDTYDLYRWLNNGWVKVDTDIILYSTTGNNADGSMTQAAVTSALNGKQDTITLNKHTIYM